MDRYVVPAGANTELHAFSSAIDIAWLLIIGLVGGVVWLAIIFASNPRPTIEPRRRRISAMVAWLGTWIVFWFAISYRFDDQPSLLATLTDRYYVQSLVGLCAYTMLTRLHYGFFK